MTDAIASGEPLPGPNGLYAILGYLLVLILLGVAGGFASRENSLGTLALRSAGCATSTRRARNRSLYSGTRSERAQRSLRRRATDGLKP